VLNGVELQQQAVQLRQVAAQRGVHGGGRRLTVFLLVRETVQRINRESELKKNIKGTIRHVFYTFVVHSFISIQ